MTNEADYTKINVCYIYDQSTQEWIEFFDFPNFDDCKIIIAYKKKL